MVDLSGGSHGPIEHGFNNAVFIVPAVLVVAIVGFFAYRLMQSLWDKEKKKEEKKKFKQQKKEKDEKKKKKSI